MESDIAHGIYHFSADPPFSLPVEEDVSPDKTPAKCWEPGYRRYATATQRERYLKQVQQRVDSGGGRNNGGMDVQFAFYCVDYHIHQHYLARRSPLNLCRTFEEMHDFRLWRLEMLNNNNHHDDDKIVNDSKTIRSRTIFTDPSPSPPPSPSPAAAASAYPGPSWTHNQLFMSHQINLIRLRTTQKQRWQRVRAARAKFKAIMKERAQQREDGLLIAKYQAAIAQLDSIQRRSGREAKAKSKREPKLKLKVRHTLLLGQSARELSGI
ncbi:hypothetical protein VTN77DRAFT_2765 [Rasamsonia byssochlamydoides]|uniref:uncharacterized protein n=1 Tax=Rasamsonia byssochlamydoides TaxID=89139 RepID=UPI0037439759